MPADSFDEYIDVEFEGMTFKGLKNYDRYLKLLYGDYMELPPEEKRYGINTASKIELKDIRLEEIQKRYADENARLN
jgi:lipopolysaccharide cholinephosphotransferase